MARKFDAHVPRASDLSARRLGTVPLRAAMGMVVALILLYIFARLANVGNVLLRLKQLRVDLALLCGAAFLSAYAVRALRWRRIMAPSPISIWRAVAIYQVATLINWLLPVHSGEVVKSLLLQRLDNIPISRSLPAVAADKLMDLLPVMCLLIVIPFLPFHLSYTLWLLLLLASGVLGIAALFFGLMVRRRDRALALLTRVMAKLPAAIRRQVEPSAIEVVDALVRLVARPRLLLVAAAYTAVAVCLDALFSMLAFAAVGTNVAFPVILFGYTLFNLANILPVPPGGIGSDEVLGLLIFTYVLHIDQLAVGATVVFAHAWTALLMSCSGLLCLTVMGLNLRSAFAMGRDASNADHASDCGAE